MMNKLLVAATVLAVMTGCVSTPQQGDKPGPAVVEVNKPRVPDFTKIDPEIRVQPLNPKCAELGKMTHAVALARDAGISQNEVAMVVAGGPDFPLGPVIREVYTRTDIGATNGAANTYGVCIKVGYDSMVVALNNAEKAFIAAKMERMKAELAVKKAVRKKQPVQTKPPAPPQGIQLRQTRELGVKK